MTRTKGKKIKRTRIHKLDRVAPKSVVRVTFSILEVFGFFFGVGERTADPGAGRDDEDDEDEDEDEDDDEEVNVPD